MGGGKGRAWGFQGCELCAVTTRSAVPTVGSKVVPGPGISKPGLRPAGDFLSAQYLLICSFSA